MSATTKPKRVPRHVSSGGDHLRKPYVLIGICAVFFVAAWLVWVLVFQSALPV